jgi:hypothetical protein
MSGRLAALAQYSYAKDRRVFTLTAIWGTGSCTKLSGRARKVRLVLAECGGTSQICSP